MKEEIVTSPTRLPPAPGALGSRQSTPAKMTHAVATLAPLSPLTSPSRPSPPPRTPHKEMPRASPVLLASRSPPMSPPGSARHRTDEAEADELEKYARRIHDAMKKRAKPTARLSSSRTQAIGAHAVVVTVTAKQRRVVAVPTLGKSNNLADQKLQSHQNNAKQNKSKNKNKLNTSIDDDGDARHVNAGVFVLENRKTGHRYVGTTWDLRNAAAQSFVDLRDGAHPHQALTKCFQLYGEDASGIGFRVLERVAVPTKPSKEKDDPVRKSRRKKAKDDPAFDVRAMETLLLKRQLFHQRQLVRKCALVLVQRRLVRPFLAQYFPVWRRNTLELPRELEVLAAVVFVQSVVRMCLAKWFVKRMRKQRAVLRIAKFMALCAMKRVMLKRRHRKRRHESATRIQRCVRQFLQRRRQTRRMLTVKKWLSARIIQRVYRGHCERKVVRLMRRNQARERSAVALQALARGFLVRCRVRHQQQAIWYDNHASMIQSCWRGFFTRKYVYQPLRDAKQVTQKQESAVRRLQVFYRRYFVRHKLTKAAHQHVHELQQVTRIHAAYKNYLAKKCGWAAMTYKLEQTSAMRIQRAMRRWFFFARIARLAILDRREKATRKVQRVYRGSRGRRDARKRREFVTTHRAASRLQRTWRLSQAFTKLHTAVNFWRLDKSARLIQVRYRGFQRRRVYIIFRAETRRQRAATRIQSAFRSRMARREWRRRLQLQRDGIACQDCGNAAATVFSSRFSLELCDSCKCSWHKNDLEDDIRDIVELQLYRRQQRLAVKTQSVYRGFQARKILRFGTCAFCEVRAVRIACRSCPGAKTFCHSCDALFHKSTPVTKLHTDRLRIEESIRQQNAAVLLQKHVRRQQRRHTRALVAARYELAFRQQQAVTRIQRRARIFLSRCELQRLRMRKQSVVAIQRVFRGHQARVEVLRRRQRRDAALCIQRYFRGTQGRCLADLRRKEVEHSKQQTAAIVLQRHARGWLQRRRMQHARQLRAALVIQSAWRRNRAKRVLLKLVQDRNERRRLEAEAREQERLARQREKERTAAIRIQCVWRRHDARRQLVILKVDVARRKRLEQLTIWLAVERKSAIRIQKFVRRKWLTRVAATSLIMQCSVRQWLARRELKCRRVTKKAAICIQRAFRYSRVKRKLTRLVSLESVAVAGTVGGWVELFDDDSGCVYYYNRETMASQWVKPPELMGESPEVAYMQHQQPFDELDVNEPPEWVEYWDDNVGASYFYNTTTGEATWATPEGITSSGNQSEEGANYWAWPPGAPVDGKDKHYGDPKLGEATESNNQTDIEGADPAAAQQYYIDENGNAYAYDYAAYDYSAYAYNNAYQAYDASASAAATNVTTSAGQPPEGFDESLVDTSYDINYEIYMTQVQRDAERQQHEDGSPDR